MLSYNVAGKELPFEPRHMAELDHRIRLSSTGVPALDGVLKQYVAVEVGGSASVEALGKMFRSFFCGSGFGAFKCWMVQKQQSQKLGLPGCCLCWSPVVGKRSLESVAGRPKRTHPWLVA